MDHRSSFTVEVVADGVGQIRCSVTGELDQLTGPQFDGEVRQAVLSGDASSLMLDLGGITFIDSSGLRIIIHLQSTMQERNGRLVLRRPSAAISRLLEITDLTTSFDIET